MGGDVLACMMQLYDFLFFTTFLFFGRRKHGENDDNTLTGSLVGDKMIPSRLRTTLRRIKDELIASDLSEDESTMSELTDGSLEDIEVKVPAPRPSHSLAATEDAAGLFSFAE